ISKPIKVGAFLHFMQLKSKMLSEVMLDFAPMQPFTLLWKGSVLSIQCSPWSNPRAFVQSLSLISWLVLPGLISCVIFALAAFLLMIWALARRCKFWLCYSIGL